MSSPSLVPRYKEASTTVPAAGHAAEVDRLLPGRDGQSDGPDPARLPREIDAFRIEVLAGGECRPGRGDAADGTDLARRDRGHDAAARDRVDQECQPGCGRDR